jgi:hypothetical protein
VKTLNLGSIIVAGWMALLAVATPVSGGTVTITSGPNLLPPKAFTNNTFVVQVVHNPPGVTGDQLQGSGGATVAPPASNMATADISGTFTANAGDIASVSYSVTMYSATGPIAYTTSADVTFLGVPQHFTDSGTILPGLHLYHGVWQAPVGFPIAGGGTFTAMLTMNFAPSNGSSDGGSPFINVSVDQLHIQLATTPATSPPLSRALNVSTRLAVLTGDNALIGGLIITGNEPKRVLFRGIGPSLSSLFTGVLADPTLELYQGATLLQSNDNWRMDQEAEIQATGIPPTDDLESAIIRNLDPGNYTAILRGSGNTSGIGIVEAYDLDEAANSELANISTRGFVDTGDNVMIGGFILGPASGLSSGVIARAIGPSLSALGVPNALQDPYLELRDANGGLLDASDDWMSSSNSQVIIDAGLAPTNDLESAIFAVQPPGNYTVIVRGTVFGNTTGVGLVEVYRLP